MQFGVVGAGASPIMLQPVGSPGRRWQELAMQHAGIDLAAWEPSRGFVANRSIVSAGYDYYRRMQLANPNLLWSGMAFGIGPTFVAGMADVAAFNGYVDSMQSRVDSLPAPIRDAIHGAIQVVAGKPILVTRDLETKLLKMQQSIFLDQAMQHEAFLGGGMTAIRELGTSGAIDEHAVDAWRQLDDGARTGDAALVDAGNRELLRREQMQVVARDYDDIRSLTAISPIVTKLITTVGRPAIPGSRSAGDVFPTRVGRVTIPVPSIDVSRADQRWALIERDTWPAYQSLVHQHPGDFQRMLATSLDQRIADGKFRHLPDRPSTFDVLGLLQSAGGGR